MKRKGKNAGRGGGMVVLEQDKIELARRNSSLMPGSFCGLHFITKPLPNCHCCNLQFCSATRERFSRVIVKIAGKQINKIVISQGGRFSNRNL